MSCGTTEVYLILMERDTIGFHAAKLKKLRQSWILYLSRVPITK